jgi:hypothetical protein
MKASSFFFLFLFVPLASLGVLGCGGSSSTSFGDGAPAAVDVTGAWTARWLSQTGVGGGSAATFTQQGSQVTGEMRFSGSPCFAGGQFSGTISGRDMVGMLTAGGIRVSLSATVSASSLDGTYDTVQAGACTGDRGTFSATR